MRGPAILTAASLLAAAAASAPHAARVAAGTDEPPAARLGTEACGGGARPAVHAVADTNTVAHAHAIAGRPDRIRPIPEQRGSSRTGRSERSRQSAAARTDPDTHPHTDTPAPAAADPPDPPDPDDPAVAAPAPPRDDQAPIAPGRDTPVHVSFRLVDGVRIAGDLTQWDDQGIDGTFARRAWTELRYDDVWRLYRSVMDEDSALAWVDLGRILLTVAIDQPKAETLGEKALRRALRLAGDHREAIAMEIESARAEAAADRRLRDQAEAAARAERLRTETPEAEAWQPQPWPALTDEEQRAAVETMRADATRILGRAGLDIEPVETDHFLFYSDMPRRECGRWAGELDLMYARLAERFDLPKGGNIFWGKAVIFVFNERDRFRLVEAEAFGHLTPDWVYGICHPVGPKVFVSFYRQPRNEAFAAILVHETSHGFMHRYRTPRRLPTWANEGFADYLASVLFRGSPIDLERRRLGLSFIRGGGDVHAILDMTYAPGSWPGPDSIGYSVGYLLVELMIRDRPHEFGRWVDAVKDGKDWEQALAEDFGVPRDVLVDTFVRYYKVND